MTIYARLPGDDFRAIIRATEVREAVSKDITTEVKGLRIQFADAVLTNVNGSFYPGYSSRDFIEAVLNDQILDLREAGRRKTEALQQTGPK